MSKALLPPLLVLGGILTFSLWNSHAVTEKTDRWCGQLQQAEILGVGEDWATAGATLEDSYEDWFESQTYLHIVSHHDAVDDADAMYRRAMAFATAEESSEFRAEIADLQDQLRLVAEIERFSLKNIL